VSAPAHQPRGPETITFQPSPAASVAPLLGRGGASDPNADIEAREFANDVERLRRVLLFSAPIYPLFALVDWAVIVNDHAGNPWWLLVPRLIGTLLIVGAVVRLVRPPAPSRRTVAIIEHAIFTLGAATIAVMCIEYRGIASPYSLGVLIFLLCRGSVLALPWRRGVVALVIPASTLPVILLGSALFSARIRAQLHDNVALSRFALSVAFVVATVIILTWAGHIMWSIRRQLYETRSIGRYRLRRRIGMGGMGEVWAAYHPALKRDVALKILRTDAGAKASVTRFEREVKATSELTHPNTVRIFDYGVTEDGIRYYVMELLEGANLAELVRRDGPLAPERAVHLVAQAARAVAEAHRLGIVHRDLKPENLIVTSLGGEPDFVKVVDFGIAKVQGAGATLTQGVWIGTPAYMAPELVRGWTADARTDVYGLGAVLFFCLTGRPPYVGDDAAEILRAHLEADVPSPAAILGRPLPPAVEAVVARCLAKEPDARFASAAELAAALADASAPPIAAAATG
jgi:serine/threonine-protein kinase